MSLDITSHGIQERLEDQSRSFDVMKDLLQRTVFILREVMTFPVSDSPGPGSGGPGDSPEVHSPESEIRIVTYKTTRLASDLLCV